MLKSVILLFTGIAISHTSIAQLFLKPGAAQGIDACIRMLDNDCDWNAYPLGMQETNFGTDPDMAISRWTYQTVDCDDGTDRSLITFEGLSAIPAGSSIITATMRLYHPPSSLYWGNSVYPTMPLWFPNDNSGTVGLVDNIWDEATVNWVNAPGMLATPTAAIPVTNTRWNGFVDIDVTALVDQVINGGAPNNGFYLNLNTETPHREQVYATSDHADPGLWPELRVDFETPCDASFTYCLDVSNPYVFKLSANTAAGLSYDWQVNGINVGTGAVINYAFPSPNSYKVCLRTTNEWGNSCEECHEICIDELQVAAPAPCDPSFTYCINTNNPLDVSFSANGTGGIEWYIDGLQAAVTAAPYSFPTPNSHQVCLKVANSPGPSCAACYVICLSDGIFPRPAPPEADKTATHTPGIARHANKSYLLEAFPNPVTGVATLGAYVTENDAQQKPLLTVRDLSGRLLISYPLTKGTNKYSVNTSGWATGMYQYSLEVNGRHKSSYKLMVSK